MRSIKNNDISSLKRTPDLVLKNANIIDVFNQEIFTSDIAIKEDLIVGIGSYTCDVNIDCSGKYVSPGFIDSHVHVESSMVTPAEFGRCVIRKGVTTVIADPHEIVNVLGSKGMEFMLEESKASPTDIYFMLPSCVPATKFEDSGASFTDKNMRKYLKNSKIIGLGEVMDVSSVINRDSDMIKKVNLFHNRPKDGHCPNLKEASLDEYIYNGIYTDHECTSADEALMKIRKGMYILIREGTAGKNLSVLISAVSSQNYSRFMFCTDDRHITDLVNEGSIDYCVKKSIKLGLNPVMAITMATLNAAQCYGLKGKGAIAPGYNADLVILNGLENFEIEYIIKDGKLVSKENEISKVGDFENSTRLNKIGKEYFRIPAEGDRINVIKLLENSIETKRVVRRAIASESEVKGVEGENINKIAVIERHKNTGKMSVGFVEGFGLKNCSLAQTIAHDSHNIVVIGDDDLDMACAVNRLVEVGGGIVVASQGEIIECIALPVAGLMSPDHYENLVVKLESIIKSVKKFTYCEGFDPIVTLSFLSLPVIPEIKITARGLFYFPEYKFISLFE